MPLKWIKLSNLGNKMDHYTNDTGYMWLDNVAIQSENKVEKYITVTNEVKYTGLLKLILKFIISLWLICEQTLLQWQLLNYVKRQ